VVVQRDLTEGRKGLNDSLQCQRFPVSKLIASVARTTGMLTAGYQTHLWLTMHTKMCWLKSGDHSYINSTGTT